MAFADDLLEQAYHLANMDIGRPKQASLRRAVSTAYYALFHLLIDEAVGNWSVIRQRSILARMFDHGKMKRICEDHVNQFFSSGSPAAGLRLMKVAQTLCCNKCGIPPITTTPSIGSERTRLARLIWLLRR